MNTTPDPTASESAPATRVRHADASTRKLLLTLGLVGLLLGLVLFLLPIIPALAIVGLGLAVAGFVTLLVGLFLPPRLHWSCSDCGNAVVRTSKRCPVCGCSLTAAPNSALPDGFHSPLPFRAVVFAVIAVIAVIMIWAGLRLG